MAILGYNTVPGTTSGNLTGDVCFGSRFTATQSGSVTDIVAYVKLNAAGSAPMRVAIFGVGSGGVINPTPLAESAGTVNVTSTSFAWYSCPISYNIVSGTDYWLFAWVDASGLSSDYNYAADVNLISNSIALAWANTYPSWSTVGDGTNEAYDLAYAGIYANFTPTSGGLAWFVA